jgi:hypothetical protein
MSLATGLAVVACDLPYRRAAPELTSTSMKHRARQLASSTIMPARPQPATVVGVPDREPLSATLYPLVGYQRLAIRVIQQALRDLDCASPNLRETAHVFLAANPCCSCGATWPTSARLA